MNRTSSGDLEIDISGPEGNVFSIMGTARTLASQLEWEKPKIDAMVKEMMSGDYDNVLRIFDENFGSMIKLYDSYDLDWKPNQD